MTKTILIAEDDPEVRAYLHASLSCHGYDIEFARDGTEAIACLGRLDGKISLLLLDLFMGSKDGSETLRKVRSGWPNLAIVVLSDLYTTDHVASVLREGAVDLLLKPVSREALSHAVDLALSRSAPCRSNDLQSVSTLALGRNLMIQSSWSQRLDVLLSSVGAADVPVLLRGETGVGKEVLARSLHSRSMRAGRPFLKLNCAALPSELAESELFGYERGAFTGAFKTTPGKFEMANSGTILLDEIGDMDFRLQAKLLQVLQDHEFLRLGAKDTSKVDVRVMAATHCDLEQAVSESRFRQDLYYRLNVVEINVPPLRERKDEILGLAEHFIHKHSTGEPVALPAKLQEILLEHDWPGNIRELENVIRKFLVFKNTDTIANELSRKDKRMRLLPPSSRREPLRPQACSSSTVNEGSGDSIQPNLSDGERASSESSVPGPGPDAQNLSNRGDSPRVNVPRRALSGHWPQRIGALAEVERARRTVEADTILAALNSTRWNRKQAAKLLNVEYKAFLYKAKKLGIGGRMAAPAIPSHNSEIN